MYHNHSLDGEVIDIEAAITRGTTDVGKLLFCSIKEKNKTSEWSSHPRPAVPSAGSVWNVEPFTDTLPIHGKRILSKSERRTLILAVLLTCSNLETDIKSEVDVPCPNSTV